MIKTVISIFCWAGLLLVGPLVNAQTITRQLIQAVQAMEADPSLKHAIVSVYVEEVGGSKPLFAHHAEMGLPAASAQKIITAAAALELLGPDFKYPTTIGYDGVLKGGVLQGNLHVNAVGDPTFGSWRWAATKPAGILNNILQLLKEKNIQRIEGNIYLNDSVFSLQPIPGGWIWDDIGNYYGAGAWGLNWRENQYDLVLEPGKQEGAPTKIIAIGAPLTVSTLTNNITTGKAGSGDNGYIYLPPYAGHGFTQGTIPPGKPFTISGSFPYAPLAFAKELDSVLKTAGIVLQGNIQTVLEKKRQSITWKPRETILGSLYSPSLDSMSYWFLRRSINLYGEALVKTLSFKDNGNGQTENGIDVLKKFWKERGIEPSAIQIMDGSGLSPQNRVTTHALVQVLQYARSRNWYPAFYLALPEYNGMKMKSGSIGGARAYAGYHTSAGKKNYAFAIIVNNYDGPSGEVVKKMYQVLNVLK